MKKVSSICAKAEIDTRRLREYCDALSSEYNAGKLTDEDVEKEITFENLVKLIDVKIMSISLEEKKPRELINSLVYFFFPLFLQFVFLPFQFLQTFLNLLHELLSCLAIVQP